MSDIQTIESKVNQIAIEFGFREFAFTADKFETAQRALSRFVKAMNKRIEREEIENSSEIKLKLDLASNLIKRTISLKFAEEPDYKKMSFLEEKSATELLEYHKDKLFNYLSTRLPKELQYHYTILKNYQAYKVYFEKEANSKEHFEKLLNANKEIFDKIKWFSGIEFVQLENALTARADLIKAFPELFNTKLLETADTVCKLNKDKITEINQELASKRKANKAKAARPKNNKPKRVIKLGEEKTKSKFNKVAYEEKAEANNPFAALKDLKKVIFLQYVINEKGTDVLFSVPFYGII